MHDSISCKSLFIAIVIVGKAIYVVPTIKISIVLAFVKAESIVMKRIAAITTIII